MPADKSDISPPRYFGTDGIRGPANIGKMTPQNVMRLAQASGLYFRNSRVDESQAPSVLIGRDTRLSGDMIEAALIAGFTSTGVNVSICGILPTAGVSLFTRDMGHDLGVMITASHNKYQDNGIKFFGADGCKLSDEAERSIERILTQEEFSLSQVSDMGRVSVVDDLQSRYVDFAAKTFPAGQSLSGLKIVLDAANGAAYQTAKVILEKLGTKDIVTIGVKPNGVNINQDCGSTHTTLLSETVVKNAADLGVALDGDADRLIMCDEKGQVIDGDQLLGLVCAGWNATNRLAKKGLVATVMSNLGLERFVEGLGMNFIRTSVGDKHVAEAMRADGYNLGGEQSGHILMTDFSPTGDGTIAALQVLSEIIRQNKPASEVLDVFSPVPQKLKNVKYSGESPMSNPRLTEAIQEAGQSFGHKGRVLVRASGTEPLIRVMAEGDDEKMVDKITDELVAVIQQISAAEN